MARVKDYDALRRARQLFLEFRNMNAVADILRKEGFAHYGRSTLFEWKAEAKSEGDDWDEAGHEYDRDFAEAKAKMSGFNERWSHDLDDIAQTIKTTLDQKPKWTDINAIIKLLKQVEAMRKASQHSELEESEAIRELFDCMMEDHELAPILRRKWADILARVEKRMKQGKKK